MIDIKKRRRLMKQKTILQASLTCTLLMGFSAANAYTVTMHNKSTSTTKIHISYDGTEATCPGQDVELKAKATHSITTGACCTVLVTVSAIDGPSRGSVKDFYPPITGPGKSSGRSCRDYAFVIKNTEDNQLVVEQLTDF
jgi:hypothetical protein